MDTHGMTQDAARQGFSERFNCAQIVFSYLAGQIDSDPLLARRIAAAFGSGMGTGDVCGCVTGALMAIGIKYGSSESHALASRKCIARKRSELLEQFRQKHGTLLCRELLKCDVSTPEGDAKRDAAKLKEKICVNLVCDTCALAEKLLAEE